MLYHLSLYLKQHFSFFNVFHYVSFRAIASLLSTLALSFILSPWFINKSKQLFRAKSRPWTPATHRKKDDIPTMGGLLIIGLVVFNVLLWCNLAMFQVCIFLFCLVSFGAIGAWDDWRKIRYQDGISAATKFSLQIMTGAAIVGAWMFFVQPSTRLCVPFFKNFNPELGWLLIPWAVFIIVAASNAVNLTDGLDGLAASPLIFNFGTFSLLAYVAGHVAIAHYLHIPFVASAELAVLGATLIGALLGFLWYNTYPAEIFMGDVGSLALGSVLALMALMCRQELLLPISGGLFVVEVLSVIVQVTSFKLLGRRVFKMAPLHHHFELLGWQESKITIRFAIISFVLSLLALITIKIR